MKNDPTHKKQISRRAFLRAGGKYAVLIPASTVLISKSARAGGSVFVFSNGAQATSEIDCFINAPNPVEMDACLAHFGLL